MTGRLRALFFDVDGTLADTEEVHRQSFNAAFAEEGLDWHWDVPLYRKLLEVTGGKERIAHYWRSIDPQAAAAVSALATIARLHAAKTRIYEERVAAGALRLRPGVQRLMAEALAADLRLAIATTTTPANIDALLGNALGAQWRRVFSFVGDAGNAPRKKPDPQVYVLGLAALELPARQCVAFEDSANGLRAAQAAAIATVVTPCVWTEGQDFTGALRVVPDLGDPWQSWPAAIDGSRHAWLDLQTLIGWHGGATRAAKPSQG